MMEQAVRDFLMLFATIDPVATLALFVPLTRDIAGGRRRVAMRAVLYAGLVLMRISRRRAVSAREPGRPSRLVSTRGRRHSLSARLADGVRHRRLRPMARRPKLDANENEDVGDAQGAERHDVAVFPLALPSIASPGAIAAVVVLTDNHRQSIAEQSLTAAMLVVVLAMTLVLLLLAEPIYRVIGRTGSSVLVRVMGLILCSLAAEQVVAAIELIVAAARAPQGKLGVVMVKGRVSAGSADRIHAGDRRRGRLPVCAPRVAARVRRTRSWPTP